MFAQIDINQILDQHGFAVVAAAALGYAGWRFLNKVWDDLTNKLGLLSTTMEKSASTIEESDKELVRQVQEGMNQQKEIVIKLIDRINNYEKAMNGKFEAFGETITQMDKHVYALSRHLNHKTGTPVDQSIIGQPGIKQGGDK